MNEWGLGHMCAYIGKTGRGEPPKDGGMTVPSKQMMRNSSPGESETARRRELAKC